MNDRILVVGAGISGLVTAIALQRAARDVVVIERASELREIGAGISLWPNAVNALRRLGVGAAIDFVAGTKRQAPVARLRVSRLAGRTARSVHNEPA